MNDIVSELIREGIFDAETGRQVRDAIAIGKSVDEALREARGISEDTLLKALGKYFDLPFVDLEKDGANHVPSRELLSRFPARILLEHRVIPVADDGGLVTVLTSKAFDNSAFDQLRLATGIEVQPALAVSTEIERFLKKYLGVGADTLQQMGIGVDDKDDELKVVDESGDEGMDLSQAAQDASIVKFVNQIMAEALESRASDVHIEPFEDQLRVRYRIDGVLVEANIPHQVRKFQAAIVSRLKILSHLDIAEKRVPQDGRIRLKVAGRDIDLRVSVIPMIHGEAVVLRILDRSSTIRGLELMGMSEKDMSVWQRVLDLPHGIILVTGPTGSGKTTTLYAALSKINNPDLKIVTIEDPVEYNLRGINQIQVNVKAGLTFSSGLRAILRHDPDVVLIGEIRDKETAEIAVQASLTGHLVFSTLHTNDAPGAATRLVDMGIEPYLVSSSVEMVVAQRLVRTICPQCKVRVSNDELYTLRAQYGQDVPEVVYRGSGCRHCQGSGYRGRQGVFEMMPVTDELRGLILERASSRQVRAMAISQGMQSLREDGWRLIREGKTTPEEVLRMTKDEEIAIGSAADLAAVGGSR